MSGLDIIRDAGALGTTGLLPGRLLSPGPPLGSRFDELAQNLLSLPETTPGSVLVTSPEPGAGRSSVCLGLGAALARTGRAVAVLDCNVDEPRLHRLFGRPNFTGLTNALEDGGKSPGEYAFEASPADCPGLDVVPTGPVLPGSGALIGSGRLVRAVRALVDQSGGYDIALLDGPVAEGVISSPTFSGGFDGVLLVVHATQTSKSLARDVTDDLLDAGVNLLGVVLNGQQQRSWEKVPG